jgi:hypothetical protein
LIHRSTLEAQYGKYAVVSISATAEQYSQLLALGDTIAEEYGIAPPMVQLTPLAPETAATPVAGSHGRPDRGMKVGVIALQAEPLATIRYLITVTKSTGKR